MPESKHHTIQFFLEEQIQFQLFVSHAHPEIQREPLSDRQQLGVFPEQQKFAIQGRPQLR